MPMYNDVYFLEEKDCNLMSVLIETGGEYTSSSIDVSVFSKRWGGQMVKKSEMPLHINLIYKTIASVGFMQFRFCLKILV